MVDFWEVFGRMLTNDTFRKDLYKACPDSVYSVGVEVPSLGNKGLDIPADKYDIARKVVAKVITDGPISLATCGELLMILSSRVFRGLANDLAAKIQSCVNTANGSKLFYIAIGCMMLDGYVFDQFGQGVFDDLQFGALTGLERDAISTLATTFKVKKAANKACAEFWDIACSDDYQYYSQGDARTNAFKLHQGNHLHAIVQCYPPHSCDGDGPKKAHRRKGK